MGAEDASLTGLPPSRVSDLDPPTGGERTYNSKIWGRPHGPPPVGGGGSTREGGKPVREASSAPIYMGPVRGT